MPIRTRTRLTIDQRISGGDHLRARLIVRDRAAIGAGPRPCPPVRHCRGRPRAGGGGGGEPAPPCCRAPSAGALPSRSGTGRSRRPGRPRSTPDTTSTSSPRSVPSVTSRGSNPPLSLAHDGDGALAGADDRLRRAPPAARCCGAGDVQGAAASRASSRPARLSTSKRALSVRVALLTSGRISFSSPSKVCDGSACRLAFTLCPRRQPRRLRFRDLGDRPDRFQSGDAEQRHPGRDRHALAHAELGDDAARPAQASVKRACAVPLPRCDAPARPEPRARACARVRQRSAPATRRRASAR